MSRRHKKKKREGGVELNLAAMLDMAFQLLTFFILTFRPSPIEGEVALNMAPARPATMMNTPINQGGGGDGPSAFLTPQLTVRAHADGGLASVELGINTVFSGGASSANLGALDRALTDELKLGGDLVDQVQIMADPRINYEELMKVVDVAMRQKLSDGSPLTKISFVEIPQ
jgi:biopolymer transport protein ExbD